jgi:hypothetical protein
LNKNKSEYLSKSSIYATFYSLDTVKKYLGSLQVMDLPVIVNTFFHGQIQLSMSTNLALSYKGILENTGEFV